MSEKSKDLKQRLLTAGILLPIGVLITYTSFFNGVVFAVVLLIIELMIASEIHQMAEQRSYRSHLWLTSVFITLSLINHFFRGNGIFSQNIFQVVSYGLNGIFILILFLLESIHWKKNKKSFDNAIENIGTTLFTYVFLSMMAPITLLVKLQDPSGWLLTILLSIAWMTDTGGLFAGNLFGKHRLTFLSSPKKTLEGYIGASLTALLTGFVLYLVQQNLPGIQTTFSVWQLLLIAFIISLSSMIGDLGESTFKRWAHSKDSGHILPGHGGIFDRMDSAIFSAPIFYFIIRLMGY